MVLTIHVPGGVTPITLGVSLLKFPLLSTETTNQDYVIFNDLKGITNVNKRVSKKHQMNDNCFVKLVHIKNFDKCYVCLVLRVQIQNFSVFSFTVEQLPGVSVALREGASDDTVLESYYHAYLQLKRKHAPSSYEEFKKTLVKLGWDVSFAPLGASSLRYRVNS